MRHLASLVLAVGLAACYGGGGSDAPSPTSAAESTATPGATKTPSATPTLTPEPSLAAATVEVGLAAIPDAVPGELVGHGWINQFDDGWVVGILGDPRRLRTTEPLIPQLLVGETVFATMWNAEGSESTLRLLDLSTGKTQAEFIVPGGVTAPIVIDETMFFVPRGDARTDPGLLGFDLTTGASREIIAPGPMPSVIGEMGGRWSIASYDRRSVASGICQFGVDATAVCVVAVIDVATHQEIATFETGGPSEFGDNVLLVRPLDDIAGVQASSGAELWRMSGDSYYRSYLADGQTLVLELQRSGDTYIRQIVTVNLKTGQTQVLLDADVALWPQVSSGRAAVVSALDQFSSSEHEDGLVVADVLDVETGFVSPGAFQISLAFGLR